MTRPTRDKQIDLPNAIKAIAHKRLTEQGAGGLSLRAIARDLSITAPAIYNYFPRLDDLITALLVDTFNTLGDTLETAANATPEGDFIGRFMAIGLAYRQWAIETPQHYNFIFGDPIPGYQAPEEITIPAAQRGMLLLIETLESAQQAGRLVLPIEASQLIPGLRQQFENWSQELPQHTSPSILYLALTSWAYVHGLVSLEMHNQFQGILEDTEKLYRFELEALLRQIGLK